jgi:hypothetical protein
MNLRAETILCEEQNGFKPGPSYKEVGVTLREQLIEERVQ